MGESGKRATDDFQRRWRATFERRGLLRDDDAGIAGWTSSGLATRFRAFQRVWRKPARPETWLDLGCGAGTYTRFLVDEGVDAVGMDYSFPTLQKARDRGDMRILWVAGDATRLPLREQCFDGVLCFGVLQAISEPAFALASIAHVLKRGGFLWIDALNARSIPTRIQSYRRKRSGKPPHLRYDRAADLCDALSAAGLDVETLQWVPILPGPFRLGQRVVELPLARSLLRCSHALAEATSHSILVGARRRADA
jgi:SAM-dependent methyltransferase